MILLYNSNIDKEKSFERGEFLKNNIKNFMSVVKNNILVLLGFEFVFKISTTLVFVPLILKTINLLIDNAGIMFITGKNINSFMKNPFIILSFLMILFIYLCISVYEMNCIMACFEYPKEKKRIHVSKIFFLGYGRMKKSVRQSVWKTLFMMFLVAPVFNIHTFVVLCMKVDILGTVVKFLFWGLSFKYSSIILCSYAVVSGALAVMLSESGKKEKIGYGEKIKKFFISVFYVFLVGLIITVILLALYYISVLVATLVLRYFGSARLAFARLVRFDSIIYYFIAFIAMALGGTLNTAMIYSLGNSTGSKVNYDGEEPKIRGSLLKKICVSVLVMAIAIADVFTIAGYISNGSHLLEDFFISTTVTAHRGGAKFAPENTMYAVRYSIESGAEYIEIDVQLTADKEVVLLHDENLKRTTGYNGYLYNMKYEDVAKLDAGSYFDGSYSDAYIPTLKEVLEECKGKINLNIELKKSGKTDNELVDKVLEYIYLYDMQQQCVITSTNYSYLRYIKMTAPEIRTGFIANMLLGDPATLEYADFFSVKHIVVTENFVKSAHNAGKEVHVWTVNTKHLINRMKGLDVDSIITDNPVLCKKILSRKNDKRSFIELLQTILYR